jgi:hypothetical protein
MTIKKRCDGRVGEKPDCDPGHKPPELGRHGKREQDITDAVRANDQDVHRHGA